MDTYDVVIVGSGPAGLGTAFELVKSKPKLRVCIIDSEKYSSGGLRNDCKMNFTFPVGFPEDNWEKGQAESALAKVREILDPPIMAKANLSTYFLRAEKLGAVLMDVDQAHLGTDRGLQLIKDLLAELERLKVTLSLDEEMISVDSRGKKIVTGKRTVACGALVIAPGRKGFKFLQSIMDSLGVEYVDHIVDVGLRIETRVRNYPIVNDYYDPKFVFPDKVRTFCTNSGYAQVVQERYTSGGGKTYFSVNGHAYSKKHSSNGLVNFAMLNTIRLTEPVASGHEFAENLGVQAMLMGGGHPIMQRVGDFRLGKRSKKAAFNDDLFDFEPTLPSCTPGDIGLCAPAKILRAIWKSLKYLDTIVPGVLHPGTIMYYPEIKLYANRPVFIDDHFRVRDSVYMIGDGAGTSRGITAAWASGIRAAEGILASI